MGSAGVPLGKGRQAQSGFNLIQISILLTVASLVIVAVLPTPQAEIQHDATSVIRMNAILTALRQYQVANGVLPCPADPTQPIGSSSYGVAAAKPGTTNNCTGGSPAAAYADSTNHIAIGMVPVTSLGLSYDYALDGWGRDITYAVDTNATAFYCPWNVLPGTIWVNDNGNIHNTVVALVSHGKDGFGAWLPLAGSTGTAKRFDSGSTDTAQADNAQVQHGGGLTANGAGQFQSFVNKSTTNTFDDHVVYSSTQFNINAIPQSYVASAAYAAAKAAACSCSPTYRSITIDHTKVGAISGTDLTNFPMLFAGVYPYLATQANGGQVKNSNGYDIKFTSDAAGTTLLAYEQESYNQTNGAVNYWVNIPTLSHATDTVIYLQYCTANQTDQSNKAGIWTSGNTYRGVWHFGSGANGSSATNANSASILSSSWCSIPPTTTSPFGTGSAVSFNNPSYNGYCMWIGNDPTYDMYENTSTFTVEAWVNKTDHSWHWYNDWIVTSAEASGGDPSTSLATGANSSTWGLASTSTFSNNVPPADNCPTLYLLSSSNVTSRTVSSVCPALNTWYHVAATRNGTSCSIYVNGTLAGQNTGCPAVLSNTGNGTGAGDSPNGDQSEIYMDELRFSTTSYSADWINTEYNNQAWPDKAGTGVSGTSATSGFYTVGNAVASR